MPVDITTMPESELRQDLQDSLDDIAICQKALAVGITTYSGGSVSRRMEANQGFVRVITTELERRELSVERGEGP